MDKFGKVAKDVLGNLFLGCDKTANLSAPITVAKIAVGTLIVGSAVVAVLGILALAGVCPLFGALLATAGGAFLFSALTFGVGAASIASYMGIVVSNWSSRFG